MQILVIGGAGFVGTNLSLKLLDYGYYVVSVDNFITGSEANSKKLLRNPNFKFYKVDITNSRDLLKCLKDKKFDQIYHLACPTGVPNIKALAYEMLLTCSLGTKNILDLALKNNSKLVFTSSSEIYGDPIIFPQDENYTGNVDPVGPRSPYEEGKRFSESLVKMYCDKFGLRAKIVRVFNTYGPHMFLKDSRVIPKFIQSALAGKDLPVKGEGAQKRTFIFVDDLVLGLETVMKRGKIGEVYNLGSDKETAIIDLARLIIKLTGAKSKIRFIKRETHDHQARLPDLKKIKKLGWVYENELKEGIEKTLKFFSKKE